MKILVVGDYHFDIYEKAITDAFINLGHVVDKFGWADYFNSKHHLRDDRTITDFNVLFQNKFKIGPILNRINKDLISYCNKTKPDLVFIYRGTHVYYKTIDKIKTPECLVFGYNNDDPFSKKYKPYFWRHFLKSLRSYDFIYAYRQSNLDRYRSMGLYNSDLLRSYYIKSRNYVIEDHMIPEEHRNDVLFIGHFEDDGRDECLKNLMDNGIQVKIYGPFWDSSKYYNYFFDKMGEITPVYKNYNSILNGAKIALVFFSSLNNDLYTRRCFEIPAVDTLMVCEYNDEINSLFVNGKEAVYYKGVEDCLKKIRYYLKNESERLTIAGNGRSKLLSNGHEILDRANQVIQDYNRLTNENSRSFKI